MNRFIGIMGVLFVLMLPAKAQDSCQCMLNFNFLVNKVTNNYAGFADKVSASNKVVYHQLVDSLRLAAASSNNLHHCYQLMDRYRLFFTDKHLQLNGNLPALPNTAINPLPIKTLWNRAKVMEHLQKSPGTLQPLEGIWQTNGYEIGIIYNELQRQYKAFILSATNEQWKTGMLKFSCQPTTEHQFKTVYRKGDFGTANANATLHKNFLIVDQFGFWQKTYPQVKDSMTLKEFNEQYIAEVQLRAIDDETVYIRLQSCNLANKRVLDSLVASNESLLKKASDWVIDFRGNQGGSTDVYGSLLPYLYTKPYKESGDKHWMTADNTAALKKFMAENEKDLDTSTASYLNKMIAFGEKNPGAWYNDDGTTTTYPKVKKYPKRVAILSDKNNGSSGETFLLVAKGISDKVTTFGENSAGYMDYGDLLPHVFPCNKFTVYIPSRRSNYIDNGVKYSYVGIAPDVQIPANTSDWIQFVRDYWKHH